MTNKKLKIKLNNKLYNKTIVNEALNDFKEVCEGKILNSNSNNNKDIEIELNPKEDIQKLKEEFCNYVLGLMKNKVIV